MSYRSEDSALPGCAVILVLIGLVAAMLTYAQHVDTAEAAARKSALLKGFNDHQSRMVELFDQLDTDHDGLIHEEELRNHELGGKFSGKDKEAVHFLYTQRNQIGHVVGQYRSGKYSYSVLGISRIDMEQAKARVLND
jgi:hypothetical protein